MDTYVDLKGQKYYLCGRFPDKFIELLLVTWHFDRGILYLPLATVLILDEAIREILAHDINRWLKLDEASNAGGRCIFTKVRVIY